MTDQFFFCKSKRGHLRKLHDIYRERIVTSCLSFTAVFRPDFFEKEPKNVTPGRLVSKTTRLNKQGTLDKTGQWTWHNERQQQRWVRSVDNFLTTAAHSSNDRPVISQNVTSTTRAMQNRTNHCRYPAYHSDPVNKSLGKAYNFPV